MSGATGELPMRPWAGGVGSMPGTDPVWALGAVLEVLGGQHVPFVPELPARGPGADMIGRAAAVLVDLPVDLQPSGWRLVDAPGRDQSRAGSFWRQDVDTLAERADGYTGLFTIALAGPWTLAASLQRSRGEVALADPGARRDIGQSFAQGVVDLLGQLSRAVPGAAWLVQLDEPSLPDVLRGGISTASGFGRLPAVESPEVRLGISHVADRAREAGAVAVALHCCHPDAPVGFMAASGAEVVGADGRPGQGDTASRHWEALAAAVEAGRRLALGVVDARDPATGLSPVDAGRADARAIAAAWRRIGLPPAAMSGLGVTPVCGLAGSSPGAAVAVLRRVVAAAEALAEFSEDAP